MTPEEKAKIKETLLLESDGNRYGIYQINSGQEERGYQFFSLEAAKEMGFTVDGKELTTYKKDGSDTEYISDGYFHESEYGSAPAFDIAIDGITSITE